EPLLDGACEVPFLARGEEGVAEAERGAERAAPGDRRGRGHVVAVLRSAGRARGRGARTGAAAATGGGCAHGRIDGLASAVQGDDAAREIAVGHAGEAGA